MMKPVVEVPVIVTDVVEIVVTRDDEGPEVLSTTGVLVYAVGKV